MMALALVVEGQTDEPVAKALARDAGFDVGLVQLTGGKGRLDLKLPAFAKAGEQAPWLVLRDLDNDAACAPGWLAGQPTARWLCLRLAVRETEAWLLGDAVRFAEFFKVPASKVPSEPEALSDPKRALVDLVRHSSSKRIRQDIVPREGSANHVGPGYVATLVEFAMNRWRLEVASKHCDSLKRARTALASLSSRWSAYVGN